jgi:hypothetical protein
MDAKGLLQRNTTGTEIYASKGDNELIIDLTDQIHYSLNKFKAENASHPVTRVSFFGAQLYAAWSGYSLPSAAEWELAVHRNASCVRGNYSEWTLDSEGYPTINRIISKVPNPVNNLTALKIVKGGNQPPKEHRTHRSNQTSDDVSFRLVRRTANLSVFSGSAECQSNEFVDINPVSLTVECSHCDKTCQSCFGPAANQCRSCPGAAYYFTKYKPGICQPYSQTNFTHPTFSGNCEECKAVSGFRTECTCSASHCLSTFLALQLSHRVFASLTPEQLEDAHYRMLSDGFHEDLQQDISWGLLFLYTKGLFPNNKKTRIASFSGLLNPTSCTDKTTCENSRQRFLRLIREEGEVQMEHAPENVHQFSSCEFPGYNSTNTFFLNYTDSLVQRSQRSGICYMHAAAVLQHYAIAKAKRDRNANATLNHDMIDLVEHIRTNFSTTQLENYLFGTGGGGRAAEFLSSILQPDSVVGYDIALNDVDNLKNYGPLLVYGFHVYDDFRNISQHHHYGRPQGSQSDGTHAMVLVGHRYQNGKSMFLLQNWWHQKQFVEVDIEYLRRCKANFAFVETRQEEIREQLVTSTGTYFEAEDMAEGPPPQDCDFDIC